MIFRLVTLIVYIDLYLCVFVSTIKLYFKTSSSLFFLHELLPDFCIVQNK